MPREAPYGHFSQGSTTFLRTGPSSFPQQATKSSTHPLRSFVWRFDDGRCRRSRCSVKGWGKEASQSAIAITFWLASSFLAVSGLVAKTKTAREATPSGTSPQLGVAELGMPHRGCHRQPTCSLARPSSWPVLPWQPSPTPSRFLPSRGLGTGRFASIGTIGSQHDGRPLRKLRSDTGFHFAFWCLLEQPTSEDQRPSFTPCLGSRAPCEPTPRR